MADSNLNRRAFKKAGFFQGIAVHIRNTIDMLAGAQNFSLYLLDECPSFVFVLKQPPPGAEETAKLMISVLPPHQYRTLASGLLTGFATDNPAVVANFTHDLASLEKHIIDAYRDRKHLIAYLERLARAIVPETFK